jgi:RNA polymerase sigma-70 factor, ECF subfamily
MLIATGNQCVLNQEVDGIDSTEYEWIQSAMTGSLAAFNHLVSLHQDSLYGWVFSLVKDEAQAEDITQSTLITAYEKLHSFRNGSFKAWLYTIARNRSYDELRRKKHHLLFSLDNTLEYARDRWELLPDFAPLPEETLVASEQSQLIEQILMSLPDIYREVIRLVDMDGLDYGDAAEVLNLPLGTVKSRLARARMRMRRLAGRLM